MNLIDRIKKLYNYYKNPKYMIMKGIQINNRAIMFLGATPISPRDREEEMKTHGYIDESYQKLKISFKNQKYTYYKSNVHKVIWTFKELIRWRRMLPKNDSRCLEYRNLKWQNIV